MDWTNTMEIFFENVLSRTLTTENCSARSMSWLIRVVSQLSSSGTRLPSAYQWDYNPSTLQSTLQTHDHNRELGIVAYRPRENDKTAAMPRSCDNSHCLLVPMIEYAKPIHPLAAIRWQLLQHLAKILFHLTSHSSPCGTTSPSSLV